MMQGDAYSIPVFISFGGADVTPELADAVEISVGRLRRTDSDGVTYSETEGAWMLTVTQEDTFQLPPTPQPVKVRVRLKSGEVIGADCGFINVEESFSREVI